MFISGFTPPPHRNTTIFGGSWESCIKLKYPWEICSSQPCLSREVGADNLKKSLPTPVILCFSVRWTGLRNWTSFKISNKNKSATFIPTGFVRQPTSELCQQNCCAAAWKGHWRVQRGDCLSQDYSSKKCSSISALMVICEVGKAHLNTTLWVLLTFMHRETQKWASCGSHDYKGGNLWCWKVQNILDCALTCSFISGLEL